MNEKRYYSVDYDEQYYIFDSDVIRKGRVEEEAEYSYDVFANSMSSTEIIDKLNELTNENEQLKLRNKQYSMMVNANSDLNDEIYEQLQKTEKALKRVFEENEQLKKKILEEIDLEVAYVNETYSDGRMSKEQHNGAIITLRQLREKFE